MTVTAIPEQLAEATDSGAEREVVEPEDEMAEVRELGALLAQAYVALPLFP